MWIFRVLADIIEKKPSNNQIPHHQDNYNGVEEVHFGQPVETQTQIPPETVDNIVSSELFGEQSTELKNMEKIVSETFRAFFPKERLRPQMFMQNIYKEENKSIEEFYFVFSNRLRASQFNGLMNSKIGSEMIEDFKMNLLAENVTFATFVGNDFNVAKVTIIGRLK